jgi:hypothetical protein
LHGQIQSGHARSTNDSVRQGRTTLVDQSVSTREGNGKRQHPLAYRLCKTRLARRKCDLYDKQSLWYSRNPSSLGLVLSEDHYSHTLSISSRKCHALSRAVNTEIPIYAWNFSNNTSLDTSTQDTSPNSRADVLSKI